MSPRGRSSYFHWEDLNIFWKVASCMSKVGTPLRLDSEDSWQSKIPTISQQHRCMLRKNICYAASMHSSLLTWGEESVWLVCSCDM